MKKKPAKTKRKSVRGKVVSLKKKTLKNKSAKLATKKRIVKKQSKRKISTPFSLPKFYSSSVLGYYFDHCIKALDFHLRGEYRETNQYDVGIAAHAVLQECGRRNLSDLETIQETANQIVRVLVTKGRKFYDKPEPPMRPDYARHGRDLAVNFMMFNPLPSPAQFETTFSINRAGEPCKFEDARLAAKVDCAYFSVDEQEDIPVVVMRDYKSAWSTGEHDLDTLQRHIQAVMGWLHHGKGRMGVRTDVVNLRTGRTFSRLIKFNEEGLAHLEQWRKDALLACDTADELLSVKNVKGIPGAGCHDCPFIAKCKFAHAAKSKIKDDATKYAAMTAIASDLKKRLLRKLDEYGGIEVNGGIVGYRHTVRNVRKTGAGKVMLAQWYGKPVERVETENGRELGLIDVLNLGAGNIYKLGKHLFKDARERGEFFDKVLEEQGVASFGVWPKDKLNLKEMIEGENGQ